MPRWYSAFDVFQRPGSDEDSADSLRCLSAHWLTVSLSGGFRLGAASDNSRSIIVLLDVFGKVVEFFKGFTDITL